MLHPAPFPTRPWYRCLQAAAVVLPLLLTTACSHAREDRGYQNSAGYDDRSAHAADLREEDRHAAEQRADEQRAAERQREQQRADHEVAAQPEDPQRVGDSHAGVVPDNRGP